jgi:hypothetical protein
MRLVVVLALAMFMIPDELSGAEPCQEIHGRAISYSGDAFLEIWHVGTHHTFFVVDQKSTELIESYLHYPESDDQALFADFTVCPTENYKKGFSQPVIVKQIRNPRLVSR